jgi:polar amino acid transport system ATP-binding protein
MSESLGIRVRGLTKRFAQRTVLAGVDLDIPAGRTVAVIGPSGGGKSTLLRSMNGLNDFDAGEIQVCPFTMHAGRDRRHAAEVRTVRRLLGMIFQDFQLFPHLTAIQNVMEAPVHVLKTPVAQARALALRLLERVGLGDRGQAYPRELSGGQKQRVAIARAMAMEPRGLLCDEITSALDPQLKHEVLSVLEDLRRDGLTLVLVTHEIGFARRAADHVVVLDEGRLVEQGPPSQVLENPQTERTREFLAKVMI